MATKTAPKTQPQGVTIPALELGHFDLTVVGDSPLICHRWSEKAKKQMLSKQMKEAKQAKAAKNPEQDYKESLYPYPGGGYGFPSVAFKNCATDACSHLEGITKVESRGAFHVNLGEELVKIQGKPTMREDICRVGMGSADLRYRGMFEKWEATIRVTFNKNLLSIDQITNLFNVGGFAIGVGEWRPQRDGSFGMFHVKQGK
jgi:hypothetical protein